MPVNPVISKISTISGDTFLSGIVPPYNTKYKTFFTSSPYNTKCKTFFTSSGNNHFLVIIIC